MRPIITLSAATLMAVGCGDASAPPAGEPVALMVRASVAGTAVATVVLEVSGPGIQEPLVFNLTVADGLASGTIAVPAGSDRTILIRAFDASGIETHRGETTVDVAEGTLPPITIVLEPLSGDVPIDVVLGTVTVEVVPSGDTLPVDETVTLTARVRDADGNPVAAAVRWATLDPGVALVESTSDSTGLVTARGVGATQVVATVGAFGGASEILVSATPGLTEVATGLSSPLYLTAPPEDVDRLFIVEKTGRIRIVKQGSLLDAPFLDLSAVVTTNGERGLLSMAFHPEYGENGRFYVSYTDLNGDTRVVGYVVSPDPDVADAASGDTILAVAQPFSNHNGGLITFGPDGMLYVGLGDGGSGGDPQGHGQDSTTLLGALLRLDVDGGSPYAIPADNPFAGHATAREEIWAYGLRNPWRFSFDRATDDLYIADVGQNAWEELNFQPAGSAGGENYGWNVMEGLTCYNAEECDQTGLVPPVHVYENSADGCSVTGGYVYRGTELPALAGRYFFSDYCAGWVRSFQLVAGNAVDLTDHSDLFGPLSSVTSFGEDARGELYVVSLAGTVWRVGAQ